MNALQFVHFFYVVLLAADNNILELFLTGTCRNEVTADDILLKTLEIIHTSADSGFAEDLGCLLE